MKSTTECKSNIILISINMFTFNYFAKVDIFIFFYEMPIRRKINQLECAHGQLNLMASTSSSVLKLHLWITGGF